jgi:gluconokinase
MKETTPTVLILMGVSGSGKTTVGRLLAGNLGWPFCDADDYHPASNLEKMRRGLPLDDDDRTPWLQTLRELISGCLERGGSMVLACSALKDSYRHILSSDDPRVRFVYLRADPALLAERLAHREGHFFAAKLLDSQLAVLEEPREALSVDASHPAEDLVAEIRLWLGV